MLTGWAISAGAPEEQDTVSLTQQYVNLDYDPQALFLRLGEVACRYNHRDAGYKHHTEQFTCSGLRRCHHQVPVGKQRLPLPYGSRELPLHAIGGWKNWPGTPAKYFGPT